MSKFLLYVKIDKDTLVFPSQYHDSLKDIKKEYDTEGEAKKAKKELKLIMTKYKVRNPVIIKLKKEMSDNDEYGDNKTTDILATIFKGET